MTRACARHAAGEAALEEARLQLEGALAADEALVALAGPESCAVASRAKSRYSVMRKILRDGRPLAQACAAPACLLAAVRRSISTSAHRRL